MDVKTMLSRSRKMWSFKMALPDIIIASGKVFGDICRWARDAKKDKPTHTDEELKKELGNVIVSTVRWCDDLGYDPEECIELAFKAQESYHQENHD